LNFVTYGNHFTLDSIASDDNTSCNCFDCCNFDDYNYFDTSHSYDANEINDDMSYFNAFSNQTCIN